MSKQQQIACTKYETWCFAALKLLWIVNTINMYVEPFEDIFYNGDLWYIVALLFLIIDDCLNDICTNSFTHLNQSFYRLFGICN